MTDPKINQPAIILTTSFIVSIVFALILGMLFTLYSHNTFNFFLYSTYVFFVNSFIVPITVAAIFYFYFTRNKEKPLSLSGRFKLGGALSIFTFVILFLWNSVDFLFLFHQNKDFTADYLFNGLQEELIFGLYLAVPISISVIYTYGRILKSKLLFFMGNS